MDVDRITVAEYDYDGLGRRIVKMTYASGVLDETRHFYYSQAWQVIEERVDGTADTDVEAQHVWGLGYVDELILRDREAERFYALQDANSRVTAIADDAGAVAERYTYTAYGRRTVLNASFAEKTGSDYDFAIGHQGLMHDEESGLIQNRARVLHPALGRFLQRDPLGYVDGMSLYQYVGSSPLSHLDPAGLKRFIAIMHGQDFLGLDGGAARELVRPVEKKLEADGDNIVKVFNEDADNSNVVINWIKEQMKEHAPDTCDPVIVLIGHSNGGDAARKLTTKGNRIPREDWTVQLLFTVDPVGKPVHRWNSTQNMGDMVEKAVNYYQRQDKFGGFPPGFRLQGYQVAGAENVLWELDPDDPDEKEIIDTPVRPHSYIMIDGGPGVAFTSRLNDPPTVERIANEVDALPTE